MRPSWFSRWLVVGVLAFGSSAWAGPSTDAAEAAALLSRYPAGSLPVDPTTMSAIRVLGEDGTREDISLLTVTNFAVLLVLIFALVLKL